jgi:hypothetical protein
MALNWKPSLTNFFNPIDLKNSEVVATQYSRALAYYRLSFEVDQKHLFAFYYGIVEYDLWICVIALAT